LCLVQPVELDGTPVGVVGEPALGIPLQQIDRDPVD
jgi:hypothetical protein